MRYAQGAYLLLDDVASYAPLGSDAELAESGRAAGGALEPLAVRDASTRRLSVFPAWVDHPPSVSYASRIKWIP
jgi:hypothetical protein